MPPSDEQPISSPPTTPDTENAGPPRPPLTVVGIGASAGGLRALQAFFTALPADTGLTFVVVVHLSPEHESQLAALLQAVTPMPVREVTGPVAMQPNHVYVIPPGKNLVVTDSTLDLDPLDHAQGRRLQIDTFLRSLAQQQGDGAAIILSGAGSDGAVGLQAIKEQGGLVLVQAPTEAEYDSMPRSAIATGLVDVVAPVTELAAQLVAAKQTRTLAQLPDTAEALSLPAQQTLTQILSQLRVQTGHDFTGYKRATVLRRLARRLQLTQQTTLTGYLHWLRQHPDESAALVSDLLIHVTTFFRDPEAWAQFSHTALPQLFAGKGHADTVRAWVVGCATGEEAYSLAILLLAYADRLAVAPSIQLFASDLSATALKVARAGYYPEAIANDIPEPHLARYFTKDNSHYQVRPEVRERILFAQHDVLQDPPFSKLDLISCRNLLIYLQRDLQTQVFATFAYALRPGGLLFLGNAESAEGASEWFDLVDKPQRLYQRRADLRIPPLPALAPAPALRAAPPAQAGLLEPRRLASADHQQGLEVAAPPSVLVDQAATVLHVSETAGRYLRQPYGVPTRDLLDLVRPELQGSLRLALLQAWETGQTILTPPTAVQFNGAPHRVLLQVRPQPSTAAAQHALVFFLEDETPLVPEQADALSPPAVLPGWAMELQRSQTQVQRLREAYEATVEELRAANEELQSTNEEYKSTVEELETSKEELQSINEELHTVNQELKLKVDELTQAHDDLQNLFIATEIATLFLDRQLHIQRYTPPAAALFNLRPPDRERPIGELRPNLVYPELEADAQQVLHTLTPHEREVRSQAGGWWLVHVRPYRTRTEQITGVVITLVDITASKRAEAQLRASEQRLQQALAAAQLVAWEWQPLGAQLTATANFATVYGAPPSQLAQDLFALIHPEDRPSHQAQVEQVLRTGGNFHAELRLIRPDNGQLVWLEVWGYVNPEPPAAPHLYGLTLDISERKHNEQQLAAQANLLALTNEAIIACDAQEQITFWNPAAEQLYGWAQASALGQPLALVLQPQTRAADQATRQTQLAQGQTVRREVRHQRRSGAPFWVETTERALFAPSGELTGYLLVTRDITERKQAETALRQAQAELEARVQARTRELQQRNQELDQFVYIASHDLKAPLRGLKHLARWMQEDRTNQLSPRTHNYLQKLEVRVQQFERLLEDVLSYARAGRQVQDIGRVELKALVQEIWATLEPPAGFTLVLAEPLPVLVAERALLTTVFRNLLSNAVHHHHQPSAGRVEVAATVADPWLTCRVTDNGPGINPLFHARIFELFQTLRPQEEGRTSSGIGLAIVKKLVESQGGQIEVESAEGAGTTFRFTWPLVPPATRAAP